MNIRLKVGVSDIFQIEARAIYEKLTLTWKKGFCKVVTETDNALLIEIIGNDYVADNNLYELI
ncbi:hypothetical protein J1N35_024597 [Gossypium stocksii]|uniref:RNase H type-1 domain-containing protein n=1 Tax=Gossypium stocksii TaxID=47602 RepID=A0A9D3V505_9ROSI|nr:hypothetical protein J1N35_024597 [Gossypium stocksii]